jgi:hypothetical protein
LRAIKITCFAIFFFFVLSFSFSRKSRNTQKYMQATSNPLPVTTALLKGALTIANAVLQDANNTKSEHHSKDHHFATTTHPQVVQAVNVQIVSPTTQAYQVHVVQAQPSHFGSLPSEPTLIGTTLGFHWGVVSAFRVGLMH